MYISPVYNLLPVHSFEVHFTLCPSQSGSVLQFEAAAVNLIAGEKPADVYSEIAARYNNIYAEDRNLEQLNFSAVKWKCFSTILRIKSYKLHLLSHSAPYCTHFGFPLLHAFFGRYLVFKEGNLQFMRKRN